MNDKKKFKWNEKCLCVRDWNRIGKLRDLVVTNNRHKKDYLFLCLYVY